MDQVLSIYPIRSVNEEELPPASEKLSTNNCLVQLIKQPKYLSGIRVEDSNY